MNTDTSISAEVSISELQEFGDSNSRHDQLALQPSSGGQLPVIGDRPVSEQQWILGSLLVIGFIGLLAMSIMFLTSASRGAEQVAAAGSAVIQSQRLAKSVSQALIGNKQSFQEVKESSDRLVQKVASLRSGSLTAPSKVKPALESVAGLVDRADTNAKTVMAQQDVLTRVGDAIKAITRQSSDLLEHAQAVADLKLQANSTAPELAATGQLVMLTQRISKSAGEFLAVEGVSPEAVFLLRRDLNLFRSIAVGLREGDAELRLPPTRDPQTLDRLTTLLKRFEETRAMAAEALISPQGLASAREAQAVINADSDALRTELEEIQAQLSDAAGFGFSSFAGLLMTVSLIALGGAGMLRLYVWEQGQRASSADAQRQEAEHQEQEAKRVNDANQAAILRLMNELQLVAEGDLTQQATVTEDITGAIADSVNYTVEELRTLVSQVQGTVSRMTETTQQVDVNSTELLAASTEQLREIRDTGESVLQMASRINNVSSQAQETALVARQSLDAAESGLRAVQNTIGGMNSIRDQIQDTSKRIKRLGESSQEIGEITELISDITEQTNVLALNAAIQAASAGEAGRGFSVVAEEVQRLAERSGDATRQIAALVKTIQTDTQDAVGAMERSTQGVVEGTRLTDAAGAALGDIDRVSRRLAELIENISSQALSEAASANVVAANIQHIFAVTEQTGEGTRSTAQMVRELSKTAEELKQSVARFKIA
jgi:twitching motility protein PilJ